MSKNNPKPRPRKSDQVDALCVGVVHCFDLLREVLIVIGLNDEERLTELDQIQAYIVQKCAKLDIPIEEIEALAKLQNALTPNQSGESATLQSSDVTN